MPLKLRLFKNPRLFRAGSVNRTLAGDIVSLQDCLSVTSKLILTLATAPEFDRYSRILKDFGYRDLMGLMLIHIYPFDRFLVNGKPTVNGDTISRSGSFKPS